MKPPVFAPITPDQNVMLRTGQFMFERYTEKARRTIFFGRYEASRAFVLTPCSANWVELVAKCPFQSLTAFQVFHGLSSAPNFRSVTPSRNMAKGISLLSLRTRARRHHLPHHFLQDL